jgi:ribonuclease HII
MKTGRPEIDDSDAEWVVGSDEVGYGSWAGPLVVCAVAVKRTWSDASVGDSKKLTPKKRRDAYERWTKVTPVLHHLVEASPARIDELGVWQALLAAHRKALETLLKKLTGTVLVVVDGFKDGAHHIGVPGAIGLPKADDLIPAVSLASIIAKVTRDEMMERYARQYPGYALASNKGYGTADHQAGLDRLGPCALHRRSYAPIAERISKSSD